MGGPSRNHYVVNRGSEILEERPQGGRIIDIEGRSLLRANLDCCFLEAFRVAAGEDNAGALGAAPPGGFQPDAGAASDDNDGLA
jgi:hypothetical protein